MIEEDDARLSGAVNTEQVTTSPTVHINRWSLTIMPDSARSTFDRSQLLINRLKMIVFECGFTDEDAKQFGNLSKIDTWVSLLKFYLVKAKSESLDTVLDIELDNH